VKKGTSAGAASDWTVAYFAELVRDYKLLANALPSDSLENCAEYAMPTILHPTQPLNMTQNGIETYLENGNNFNTGVAYTKVNLQPNNGIIVYFLSNQDLNTHYAKIENGNVKAMLGNIYNVGSGQYWHLAGSIPIVIHDSVDAYYSDSNFPYGTVIQYYVHN